MGESFYDSLWQIPVTTVHLKPSSHLVGKHEPSLTEVDIPSIAALTLKSVCKLISFRRNTCVSTQAALDSALINIQ